MATSLRPKPGDPICYCKHYKKGVYQRYKYSEEALLVGESEGDAIWCQWFSVCPACLEEFKEDFVKACVGYVVVDTVQVS